MSLRTRSLAGFTALALCLQPVQPLLAANHPNSRVVGTNVINLTANVDWDYDAAPPMQAGTGGVRLTKDVLRNKILRETARSVFLMTEGRHRVGTIYVYKNGRFGRNVDIQIINKADRSYANAAKWQKAEGSSYNFLAMDGRAENLRNYARVIAHELGHYVYGFADEYREEGKAQDPSAPFSPAGNDYTRATIMHDHESFTRLSVAEDYRTGNATSNNNAQARLYATDRTNLRGGSHWEMLTRNPANDPAEGKDFHEGDRTWFAAFRNLTPPATVAQLTRYFGVLCDADKVSAACGTADASRDQSVPAADRIGAAADYDAALFAASGGVNGADAADGAAGTAFADFKVIFVDSPAPVTVPPDEGDGEAQRVRAGVKTRLGKTPLAVTGSTAVSRHALVIDRTLPAKAFEEAKVAAEAILELAAPGSQWAVITSPPTGSGPLVASAPVDTDRARMVAAVQALTRADGRFDAATAFTQAQAQVEANRQEVDGACISLVTAQGTTVPADLGSRMRDARTAVNAIGMLLPVGSTPSTVSGGITLDTLSAASGGRASNARNAEQAIKEALRADREASGEVFALLATAAHESLPLGVKVETFTVTAHDHVVSAHWYFDPADKAKLSFELVTPAGTFKTLSPDSDLDDGYALIEVDNAAGTHNGTARAVIVANSAVANPVGLDVQAESEIELIVDLEGGTLADNRAPVIRVQLTGNAPIAKAQVLATVYNADTGLPVLSDLVLRDDGQGVDTRADDGRYALSLADRLEPGDYTISVRAVTTASSVFQPNQIFAIGAEVPVRPVGAGLVRGSVGGLIAAPQGGHAAGPAAGLPPAQRPGPGDEGR
ncbi:choice-of-anchor X domain-containing protein [Piscinibacter sakaiensis]|uniref:choice-of-anchor X domain-containing protein n=1 Tax=Piscinibacter sakaiensis TaxID=1547922 RepID=UPI00372770EB